MIKVGDSVKLVEWEPYIQDSWLGTNEEMEEHFGGFVTVRRVWEDYDHDDEIDITVFAIEEDDGDWTYDVRWIARKAIEPVKLPEELFEV